MDDNVGAAGYTFLFFHENILLVILKMVSILLYFRYRIHPKCSDILITLVLKLEQFHFTILYTDVQMYLETTSISGKQHRSRSDARLYGI